MELKDFFNFVPQFPVTGFDLQSFLLLPIPTILIWNFGQDVFITGALPNNQQVPKAMISSLWLFLHYYFLQDKVSGKCLFHPRAPMIMVLNIYFMLFSFFFQIDKNDYSQLEHLANFILSV